MKPAGKRLIEWLIVFLSVVLAWLPMYGRYIFIYDDYYLATLLDDGVIQYFVSALQREGLWRILGLLVISLMLRSPVVYFGVVTLAHAIASCLFLEISTAVFKRRTLAFLLTLVMAAYPWSHQCFWWASAIHFPLSTVPLLLSILLFVTRYQRPERQLEGFWVTGFLTAISIFIFEGVAFAAMCAGTILWWPRDASSLKQLFGRTQTYLSAWGPVVATVVCLLGISQTQPPSAWKQVDLNPETLLSSIYYQYTNLLALMPLLSPEGRSFMFWGWNPLHFGLAATVLIGIACLLFGGVLQSDRQEPAHQNVKRVLPYFLLLLVGLGAAYVLGGGFSLDARKKYPFVPVLLWLAAVGISGLVPNSRGFRLACSPRVGQALALAVIVTGVGATWTTLGLVRYELHRVDALANYIRREGIRGDIQLGSSIDAYSIWPAMTSQIGWRLDNTDFLTTAVGDSDLRRVENDNDCSPTKLYYVPETSEWRRVAKSPTENEADVSIQVEPAHERS